MLLIIQKYLRVSRLFTMQAAAVVMRHAHADSAVGEGLDCSELLEAISAHAGGM